MRNIFRLSFVPLILDQYFSDSNLGEKNLYLLRLVPNVFFPPLSELSGYLPIPHPHCPPFAPLFPPLLLIPPHLNLGRHYILQSVVKKNKHQQHNNSKSRRPSLTKLWTALIEIEQVIFQLLLRSLQPRKLLQESH